MPRADAVRSCCLQHDFWLFDSRLVARFVFDEDDATLGIVLKDLAEVAFACQARDAAWHSDAHRGIRQGGLREH
ncbi:hypothetical protein SBADM41S_02293 [Streptomyces badius]